MPPRPFPPHPPRLGHLATRAVVVAKLTPTYAQAHDLDQEEASIRLDSALRGELLDDVLDATWVALNDRKRRIDPNELLERVAESVKERGFRPGKAAPPSPHWSAFHVLADLAADIASEAARRVMESDEGQRRGRDGLAEVGRYLAVELTRKKGRTAGDDA